MTMSATAPVCDMASINRTITRNIEHARITRERQDELLRDKERLLTRLTTALLSDDYATRNRLLNEYRSLSRIINENEYQLEGAS